MDFQVFHDYRKLVRRGLAPPLTCFCRTEYVVRIDDSDEPVLHCYTCDTITRPGIKIIDQMKEYLD
jgi:hypothetical protein